MQKVILIVGPTAVGKTGASILMARDLDTEIISTDSMQIYRHMDIGTEKPTAKQLSAVKHHMIDMVEPTEDFSVGKYLRMVTPIVDGLHKEGRVPVFVGGTGLYVRAMTRGLFKGPEADIELRQELDSLSPEQLYGRLKELDPEAAETIDRGNVRRLIRTLEICIASGDKASTLKREGTVPMPWEFIKIALKRDREELYEMIERRVDGMLERGLMEEVRALMDMNPARTPMQAIGYKEVAAHMRGEYGIDEAIRLIKRNTRRYAKRQMTWFNSEPDLNWVDITGLKSSEEVYAKIRDEISFFAQ